MLTPIRLTRQHLSTTLMFLLSVICLNSAYAGTFEAEDAAISGADTGTHPSASQQGYVDFTAEGQTVELSVNAPSAGTYILNITEANGRGWSTGVDVIINNHYALTDWLTPTGGWTEWTTKEASVNLDAGINKIRLKARYHHSQNIDKISIDGLSTSSQRNASSTTSSYEAESAILSGAVTSNNSAASNQRFVDFTASGQFIEFTVSATNAGNYTMHITEANGRTMSTGADILVNGRFITTDWLKPTGGWGNWVTEQTNIPLNAGSNRIRIKAKYAHSQNIDKISLSGSGAGAPPPPAPDSSNGRYEAESASVTGADIRNNSNASNQKYVDFTKASQSIQFNVSVGAAGSYRLNITEANGRSWKTGMDIIVNGQAAATDWLSSTSGWTNWQTKSHDIYLNNGLNRIKFVSRYDHSQNIDFISVSASNSPAPEPDAPTPNPAPPASSGMGIGTNLNFQNPHADSGGYNGVSAFKKDINWSTTNNPWNTQFLSDIGIYSSLRFMNWSGTNGSNENNWNNRVKKTDYGQDQHWDGIKPVSWEWMIDLSNRTGANMWVNLPHLIVNRNSGTTGNLPNDYARKLAILIKHGVDMQSVNLSALVNGNYSALAGKDKQWFINHGGIASGPALNPTQKIYVEYSNEVWNFGNAFTQTRWAGSEGLAMGIPFTSSNRPDRESLELVNKFSAYAHTLVWNSFMDVYGNDAKVIKVLGHHKGDLYFLEDKYELLNNTRWNKKNTQPDYVAVGSYFGASRNGSDASIWNQLQTDIDTIVKVTRDFKTTAMSKYGVRTISYEGGQHVMNNCRAINRNIEMYRKYNDFLSRISGQLDLLMHYTHAGGYQDNTNCWGAMERNGQTSAPKYRALKDFIQ